MKSQPNTRFSITNVQMLQHFKPVAHFLTFKTLDHFVLKNFQVLNRFNIQFFNLV